MLLCSNRNIYINLCNGCRKNKTTHKIIFITLIFSAVYGITAIVTGQACSITYCQPKEPENLHKFFKKERR